MTVGGSHSSYNPQYNTCEYITFATESNATDAGDLTVANILLQEQVLEKEV